MKYSETPLKILVLTSTYARCHEDPQVPWMRQTVNRLKQLGHQIEVLAPSFEGLGSHQIDGVEVTRFRYAHRDLENLTHDSGAPSKVRNPLVKLLTIPYLVAGFIATTYKIIKDRPDVVKVHWPFPHGLMAWLGAKLTGAKIVSVCHGAELAIVRDNKNLEHVLSWLLKQSDLVYCNSSHTLSQIRNLPNSDYPVEIVTYGSTIENKQTNLIDEPSQSQLILSCGRVIERKGYPYLIKAMPSILKHFPNAKLVITSNGDKKAECEALIDELNLHSSVRMAGYISAEELSELYQTCAVYAHPSIIDSQGDTEGLGVVLVEALAHQKPVVASKVGGIVDVIKQDVSGRLVAEKDSEALADEIIRLLDNPDLAMKLGQSGFHYAQTHFSWERIIQRLSKLLTETCQSQSHSHHKKTSKSLPQSKTKSSTRF